MPSRLRTLEEILARGTRDDEGCLLWPRWDNRGYGQTSRGRGKSVWIHRLIWELTIGPIPPGMTIDHECHNLALREGRCAPGFCKHRRCYEISHLRLRSLRDNQMNGGVDVASAPAFQRSKTHCPRGHPYEGDNLYIRPSQPNHRICLTCLRQRSRERAKEKYVPLSPEARELANRNRGEWQRSKTHCPQGHPYQGDNVAYYPNGHRRCRTCHRERARLRSHNSRK